MSFLVMWRVLPHHLQPDHLYIYEFSEGGWLNSPAGNLMNLYTFALWRSH